MKLEQTFLITYTDHRSGEIIEVCQTFDWCDGITPLEWAQDYAYTLAEKSYYFIKEID